MKNGARQQPSMDHVVSVLKMVSSVIDAVAEETERLIGETKTGGVSKKQAQANKGAKRRASAKRFSSRSPSADTATAKVLRIVQRHKRGVGVNKLKEKTGFDDLKIRNIVYRACREGRIKRVSRGVYVPG